LLLLTTDNDNSCVSTLMRRGPTL